MSEQFPTSTIDTETPSRSPEHQAMIDKFKGLADMAATWTEQNGPAVRTEVSDETGSKIEIHDGVAFRDVEAFLANENPQQSPEENAVAAARLFNRMAIESYGMPAPENLEDMDSTSETATIPPAKVIEYAAAHLKGQLEPGSESELHNMINETTERSMVALGYNAGSDAIQAAQRRAYEDIRNRHPSSEYPTLDEY